MKKPRLLALVTERGKLPPPACLANWRASLSGASRVSGLSLPLPLPFGALFRPGCASGVGLALPAGGGRKSRFPLPWQAGYGQELQVGGKPGHRPEGFFLTSAARQELVVVWQEGVDVQG
ncbi:MAG: hypothetical protein N2447_00250 [Thermoanaerobaculum sp.]|nr:hypothetical protein [Thermoanaerobaculum sp.]